MNQDETKDTPGVSGDPKAEASKEEAKEHLRSANRTRRETTDMLRTEAQKAQREVRGALNDQAESQMGRVADAIAGYGDIFEEAAHSLADKNDPHLAEYASRASDKLHDASDYLRRQDMSSIVGTIESTIRRHPEVVLGGMFVAGLTMGRFFKAEPAESAYEEEYPSYETHGESMTGGTRPTPHTQTPPTYSAPQTRL